jgi:hypothetical protein
VIKARCFRLMSLYHLKSCMSRSRTDGSVLLSVVAQALHFCISVCACFSLSLSLLAKPLAAVSGKFRLWMLDSVLEPVAGVEWRRMFSPLGEVNTLMTSSYMLSLKLCLIFKVSFRASSLVNSNNWK